MAVKNKTKKKIFSKKTFMENKELLLLTIPAVLYFLIFHYLPMSGLVLAFKNYQYKAGIWGSPWVGLKNFEFFFVSGDLWRLVRNTVGYALIFIFVGMVVKVTIALLLYEINKKIYIKSFQTSMLLPHFVSWVIVAYITYIFLHPQYGVLNTIGAKLGIETVNWYADTKWWPLILTVVYIWKAVGMGCLIYYAALMGIDKSLFEAAEIDGANKLQKVWNISIPSILPIISIQFIMSFGSIFKGDFGLFYQIPRDVGVLYPVTDVIDTYVYRGIRTGEIGPTSAVGFIQSFVGCFMVIFVNWIVKKIEPENSMF